MAIIQIISNLYKNKTNFKLIIVLTSIVLFSVIFFAITNNLNKKTAENNKNLKIEELKMPLLKRVITKTKLIISQGVDTLIHKIMNNMMLRL